MLRKATKDDDICLSSFLLVYLVCTGSPRIRRFLSFVCLNRALGSLGVFMDGFYHGYIRTASVRKATKDDDICFSASPSLPYLYRESYHETVLMIKNIF